MHIKRPRRLNPPLKKKKEKKEVTTLVITPSEDIDNNRASSNGETNLFLAQGTNAHVRIP